MDLVNDNLKLAYSIANKKYRLYNLLYPNLCLNLDDLKQEASLALIQASKKFDSSRGCKFSTYAYKYINRAVHNYIFMKCPVMNTKDHNNKYNLEIVSNNIFELNEEDIVSDDYTYEVEHDIFLDSVLNDKEKKYLVEHYVDGTMQTELARRDGLSQAGVRYYIQQGLKKLRKVM